MLTNQISPRTITRNIKIILRLRFIRVIKYLNCWVLLAIRAIMLSIDPDPVSWPDIMEVIADATITLNGEPQFIAKIDKKENCNKSNEKTGSVLDNKSINSPPSVNQCGIFENNIDSIRLHEFQKEYIQKLQTENLLLRAIVEKFIRCSKDIKNEKTDDVTMGADSITLEAEKVVTVNKDDVINDTETKPIIKADVSLNVTDCNNDDDVISIVSSDSDSDSASYYDSDFSLTSCSTFILESEIEDTISLSPKKVEPLKFIRDAPLKGRRKSVTNKKDIIKKTQTQKIDNKASTTPTRSRIRNIQKLLDTASSDDVSSDNDDFNKKKRRRRMYKKM